MQHPDKAGADKARHRLNEGGGGLGVLEWEEA